MDKQPADAGSLATDLKWPLPVVEKMLADLSASGLIEKAGALLRPTPAGQSFVQTTIS